MRLGQLARKLAVTPAEIIEFLVANQVQAEEGINTKLEKEQVVLIMQRFAPAMLETISTETVIQEEAAVMGELPPVEETNGAEHSPTVAEENGTAVPSDDSAQASQSAEEKPEVIKASKVELAGLKVLGKIELPTSKKAAPPEEETTSADTEPSASPSPSEGSATAEPRPERRPKPVRKDSNGGGRKNNYPDRRDQRPRKNPVALQREREEQEAEKKRQAEAERKKEKQTQHYLKKVKTSGPTKAAKLYKEEVVEMSDDFRPTPKTWFGKLLRWFKS